MSIPKTIFVAFLLLCISLELLFAKGKEYSIQELKLKYGNNKEFIAALELPALLALAYFPELANTNIQFQYKKIYTTMAAKPTWSCLFSANRKYVISLNSEAVNTTGVDFENLPLEAKVGILAHEFSHISQYETISKVHLVLCGIAFKCLPSYHRNLERKTDIKVIDHGLGSNLLCFAEFVLTQSSTSENYKRVKKRFYLSPAEIASKL